LGKSEVATICTGVTTARLYHQIYCPEVKFVCLEETDDVWNTAVPIYSD
jgi:hypothetical protein